MEQGKFTQAAVIDHSLFEFKRLLESATFDNDGNIEITYDGSYYEFDGYIFKQMVEAKIKDLEKQFKEL